MIIDAIWRKLHCNLTASGDCSLWRSKRQLWKLWENPEIDWLIMLNYHIPFETIQNCHSWGIRLYTTFSDEPNSSEPMVLDVQQDMCLVYPSNKHLLRFWRTVTQEQLQLGRINPKASKRLISNHQGQQGTTYLRWCNTALLGNYSHSQVKAQQDSDLVQKLCRSLAETAEMCKDNISEAGGKTRFKLITVASFTASK